MRLKSEVWVKAYIRICFSSGVAAAVTRRGNSEAGAIFIKINRLDGQCVLFGPAPAGLDGAGVDRRWCALLGGGEANECEADAYLSRQGEFDPDYWVIEVEDRQGRHFLGDALVAP